MDISFIYIRIFYILPFDTSFVIIIIVIKFRESFQSLIEKAKSHELWILKFQYTWYYGHLVHAEEKSSFLGKTEAEDSVDHWSPYLYIICRLHNYNSILVFIRVSIVYHCDKDISRKCPFLIGHFSVLYLLSPTF